MELIWGKDGPFTTIPNGRDRGIEIWQEGISHHIFKHIGNYINSEYHIDAVEFLICHIIAYIVTLSTCSS